MSEKLYFYYTRWLADLNDGNGLVRCHSGWISAANWNEFTAGMHPGSKMAMEFDSLKDLNDHLATVGLPPMSVEELEESSE